MPSPRNAQPAGCSNTRSVSTTPTSQHASSPSEYDEFEAKSWTEQPGFGRFRVVQRHEHHADEQQRHERPGDRPRCCPLARAHAVHRGSKTAPVYSGTALSRRGVRAPWCDPGAPDEAAGHDSPSDRSPPCSAPPPPEPPPVAAVLFGICFFLTVASVNVPHTSSDAKLLAWWQVGSNVQSGVVSLFFAVCTAVLFAVVVNYVLSLVARRARYRRPRSPGRWPAPSPRPCWSPLRCAACRAPGPGPGRAAARGRRAALLHGTELHPDRHGRDGRVRTDGAGHRRDRAADRGARALGRVRRARVRRRGPRRHDRHFGQFTIPIAIVWSWCVAVAIWRQPAPIATSVPAAQETAVA